MHVDNFIVNVNHILFIYLFWLKTIIYTLQQNCKIFKLMVNHASIKNANHAS